jgi:hypothetical protein
MRIESYHIAWIGLLLLIMAIPLYAFEYKYISYIFLFISFSLSMWLFFTSFKINKIGKDFNKNENNSK